MGHEKGARGLDAHLRARFERKADSRPTFPRLDLDEFGLFDHNVFNGHIAVEAARGGANETDRVDHFLTGHDLAENGITPTLSGRSGVVEEVIVNGVDEELSRGGMGIRRTGHGNGVLVVLQTVRCFVFDRIVRGLLVHTHFETAALDHETLDDAVEDRAVVEAFANVLFEVGGRLRGVFMVEFDVDDTVIGSKTNHVFFNLYR